MENITYSISLKNNCSYPSVKVDFCGAAYDQILPAIAIAQDAFSTIEVVCEQTGELYYNSYVNDDLFHQTDTCGSVIDRIAKLLYS